MPNYKSSQVDEDRKTVYKDIYYPITKAFQEMLQDSILEKFKEALEMKNEEPEQDKDNPFIEGKEPKQINGASSRKESVKQKLDEKKDEVSGKTKKSKTTKTKTEPVME